MLKKLTVLMLTLGSMAMPRSERLSGLVLRVIDGDTVGVLLAEAEQSVRRHGIHASERHPVGGKASRQSLQGLDRVKPGHYQRLVSACQAEDNLLAESQAWSDPGTILKPHHSTRLLLRSLVLKFRKEGNTWLSGGGFSEGTTQ